MSLPANNPLHVLRGLLRHLKTPPLSKKLSAKQTSVANASRYSPTATYVLEQYRVYQSETDPVKTLRLRSMATNALTLISSIEERQRLYEMDSGADVKLSAKELTRRAAARAGLQPPKLDVPREE